MKFRTIALYLPQYHPIPENDKWWGPGFTEWTNVARARPLFRNHYQPHIPADLGFYDLRLEETRMAQAALARKYGISGFCYYHYWFGNGRRLLQRPFDEVLSLGKPDFPFCLAWANETWAGVWHGITDSRTLIEQTYPGEEDHRQHFQTLLPAFFDPRYIRIDNKPLFVIYRPYALPDPQRTLNLWRRMAQEAGLAGLYLVGQHHDPRENLVTLGLDSIMHVPTIPKRRQWNSWSQPLDRAQQQFDHWQRKPTIIPFEQVLENTAPVSPNEARLYFPTVIPNWDNTPRSQHHGLVLHGSTPELFALQLRKAYAHVFDYPSDERIIFIKSWNEWGEGNHLEPDLRFGHSYLMAVHNELQHAVKNN